MLLPLSDRALRRMVAKLASLNGSDLEAVLEALDPAEREKVERLLSSYARNVLGEPSPSVRLEGLSPWLAARTAMANPDAKAGVIPTNCNMTPIAAITLRQCAQDLLSEHPSAPVHRAGALGHWIAHLSGRDLRSREPGRRV